MKQGGALVGSPGWVVCRRPTEGGHVEPEKREMCQRKILISERVALGGVCCTVEDLCLGGPGVLMPNWVELNL